jgi:ABC-type glycerol-3-phosphate transport system substrate-binding protein
MTRLAWTKAKALGVAACALLPLAAAACGGASSSDQSGGKVTLTYLRHFQSQPGDGTAAAVAKKFEAAHPNVHVNVQDVQPGSEFAKFQTLLSAGTPPDVYLADAATMATMLDKRVLAPVDFSAVGARDLSDLKGKYLEGALGAYTVKGSLYGVPSEVSNYGAWMNQEAFKAAGLNPPKTWDEVCADGPKMLKTTGDKITQVELALPTNPPDNQLPVIEAIAREFGGPVFNDDGTKAYLSSQPVIDAMTMLQKLVYDCKAAAPSLNGSTTDADRLAFSSGQAAILLTGGSWYAGSLKQANSPAAPPVAAPFAYPTRAGQPSQSVSYGYAWVVPRGSKNQKLAWQFVKALADDGMENFKQDGLFNGTLAVANSDLAAQDPSWNTVWKPTLASAPPEVSLVRSSQVIVIIGNAMNDIVLNHADVRTTLEAAQAKVTPLLNKQ